MRVADHRCWSDSPWQARDLWMSVPQGESYWKALTGSSVVQSLPLHLHATEEIELMEPCSIGQVCVDVDTSPAFQGLVEQAARIERTKPDALPHQFGGCGVFAVLDDPLVFGCTGEGIYGEWEFATLESDVNLYLNDPRLNLYDEVVVPVWQTVLFEDHPDLRLAMAEDTWLYLEAVDSEPALLVDGDWCSQIRSDALYQEIVRQQRADWIAMLKERNDACSRSQLQQLQQQHWA